MTNYLINTVETWRVRDIDSVKALQEEVNNDPRYEVKKFEYQSKEVKEKGDIVDEYQLVKITKSFNDPKFPNTQYDIEYR